MTKPLSGITVIDFTHVLAGPACAYYLGLLGATVIKVESVGRGDAMRHRSGTDPARAEQGMSTAYLAQGAGKASVALDLSCDQGQQVMHRLLAEADVLVENHLPVTMRALGLDENSLRQKHPHLIHCAMTGYGRGGEMEDAPAYDVNIQAACGIMSLTGTADTGPLRTGAPIMDYSVALAAGFAISTALYQREKTGTGSFIDVSMLETGLSLMTSTITDFLATGNAPVPRGNAANSRTPGAGSFSCARGTLALGANEEPQFRRLADTLGRSHWVKDARYATRAARKRHAAELEQEIADVLMTRTAQEWEDALLANQVPAARVRTLPESLEMPQVAARHYLQNLPSGTNVATLPFRMNHAPAHGPATDAPTLGADTVLVLRGLGYSAKDIGDMIGSGVLGSPPVG